MKSGKRQGVEILNQGCIRIADDFIVMAKCDAWDACERRGSGQCIHKFRKDVLRFTTDHDVNRRKGPHCRDIDDRRLWTSQYQRRAGMRSLDLSRYAKRQRIAATNCTETKDVEIALCKIIFGKSTKI